MKTDAFLTLQTQVCTENYADLISTSANRQGRIFFLSITVSQVVMMQSFGRNKDFSH